MVSGYEATTILIKLFFILLFSWLWFMGTSARDAGLMAVGSFFDDTPLANFPLSIVLAVPWVVILIIEVAIRIKNRSKSP